MDPDRKARLRALRDAFLQAHKEGVAALAAGDREAFRKVLRREREILDEQEALLEQEQAKTRALLKDIRDRFFE